MKFGEVVVHIDRGGGTEGVGPPLELEIYLVKFLKIWKKNFFFSSGPPLGKNRSSAPVHILVHLNSIYIIIILH